MGYLALTDADREAMLETIGVSSVEELFADLPGGVRLGRELELAPAMSEQELSAHLAELAARNVDATAEVSFLGAGIYDHYVPAVVDEPELVNADPYGEGWLVRIRLNDPSEAETLLDADAYKQVVAEQ